MINSSNDDDQDTVAPYDVELEARRRRNLFLLTSGLMVGIPLVVCIFFYSIVPAENSQAALRKLVPFLATATATSTPTPTALFADPAQNYFATATAYPSLQSGYYFHDEFDTDTDTWCLGDDDDSWSTNSFRIEGGQYLWSVTAKRDMILRCTLEDVITLPEQFQLSTAVSAAGTDDAEVVLVFHETATGSYYLFSLYPASQAFDVYLYMDEEWIELIPYTFSAVVDSAGLNQMAVVADGSRYVLFINGEYVGTVEDDRLSGGSAGLAISLSEGESADFVFDNFEVKYP
jgi:hypothetical protein